MPWLFAILVILVVLAAIYSWSQVRNRRTPEGLLIVYMDRLPLWTRIRISRIVDKTAVEGFITYPGKAERSELFHITGFNHADEIPEARDPKEPRMIYLIGREPDGIVYSYDQPVQSPYPFLPVKI